MSSLPGNLGAALLVVELPVIHQGIYCDIYQVPALFFLQVAPGLHQLKGNRIAKVFRLLSVPQHQIEFNNMLTSLSGHREAVPIAYAHKYITPFEIAIVDEITGLGPQPTLSLVTPWYGNGDILNYTDTNPLISKLSLIIQAATALEHLHHYNVVHGHIHPGNIFITDCGCATVTDIGVYTQTCRLILYPYATIPVQYSSVYQPPELLYPGTDAFVLPAKSSDVYSFASVIYAVFTGRAPFHGRNLNRAVAEILRHGHSRIRKPADMSEKLWNLLQHCWNRNPNTRPDMEEVLTQLEDIELYD